MPDLPIDPSEYLAGLPRHLAAAGVVFHDDARRVLLVRSPFGEQLWDLPGGAMDAGETPSQTARREIKEELGLELSPPIHLLGVDWVEKPDGPAMINFVFDGGPLTEADAVRRIVLQASELTEWQFVGPDAWSARLIPRKARRLHSCANLIGTGQAIYMEDGWPT